MRLAKLTGLEREKTEQEHAELQKQIAYFKQILADEGMLLGVIKDELLEVKARFADERRTEISSLDGEIDMLDLIQEEDMVVTLTHYGYVKRLPKDTYRAQKRGGKGVVGATTREEDFVEQMYVTSTHDPLLFFTDRGRVYRLNCYEIPEAGRTARGTAIVNLLKLDGGEKVRAMLPMPRELEEGHYLVMATRRGLIKRTETTEFANLRSTGLIAIVLREDDDLIGVALTDGSRDVLLGSKQGMAIRFSESEMRPIGRAAMGVKSMELDEGDEVVDMSVVEDGAQVLSITENGYGKRTEIDEYRLQGRGGKGIKAMNLTDKRERSPGNCWSTRRGHTHHHRRRHHHSHAGEFHLRAGPQHAGRAIDARAGKQPRGLRRPRRGRRGGSRGGRPAGRRPERNVKIKPNWAASGKIRTPPVYMRKQQDACIRNKLPGQKFRETAASGNGNANSKRPLRVPLQNPRIAARPSNALSAKFRWPPRQSHPMDGSAAGRTASKPAPKPRLRRTGGDSAREGLASDRTMKTRAAEARPVPKGRRLAAREGYAFGGTLRSGLAEARPVPNERR